MKNFIFFVSLMLSNFTLLAEENYAVTTTNLNLREKNTTNSTSLKVLNQGDTLEILSEDSNWSKVKFDNIEGYVSTEYLSKIQVVDDLNKKTFNDQKGFVAGFKYVFIQFFIVIFIIVGGLITYSLRKKDSRYKKGYREGKMSEFSMLKLAFYAAAVSAVAGFIGGLISIFH